MKPIWPTKKLGDQEYFEILGSGIKKFDGEKEYLSTSSIEGARIISIEGMISYKNRPSRANMQPKLNSVWFARMKNTIKVYSFTKENSKETDRYILSTGFAGIFCNIEKVLPKYLEKIFLSKWFNNLKDGFAGDKAIQKSLNNADIKNLEIPISLLSIQQKIVYVLDSIQEAVGAQEKIIELAKELKKSLMVKLFREGAPSFSKGRKLKKTEISEIPEDWEIVEIKNIGKVITGSTPSTFVSQYWNGKIPFVTPADFDENRYVLKTERTITENGAKQAKIIPPNSVLVVCIGSTIGKIALSSNICVTNQQINSVVCDKEVNPIFIYYALFLKKNSLRSFAGLTAKPILKKSLFEKVQIFRPSLPEQREIAKILQTVDQKIEIEQKKKALYEELFKTMLNKLMMREIEVDNLNLK